MSNKDLPTAEHPELTLLHSALEAKNRSNGKTPKYEHLTIGIKNDFGADVLNELFEYINHAHEGARLALRAPLGDSLHPLHYNTEVDPALGYPHKLHESALMGFFGEIIAGIVAGRYVGGAEFNWEVPVYLFRTHIIAFQQLESQNQSPDHNQDRSVFGRTGNDGLAFARDINGRIVACLDCEAKCTSKFSPRTIEENFDKLNKATLRPVDLLRIVDALGDYKDDEYSRSWIQSIRMYWFEMTENSPSIRCDFSMFVFGQNPVRKSSYEVIDSLRATYTGGRHLTCAEMHMPSVKEIISALYKKMETTL